MKSIFSVMFLAVAMSAHALDGFKDPEIAFDSAGGYPRYTVTVKYTEPWVDKQAEKKSGPYWMAYLEKPMIGDIYRLDVVATAPDGTAYGYRVEEKKKGDKLLFRGIAADSTRLHGKTKVEAYFTDMQTGVKTKIDERECVLPDYLEVFCPAQVGIDREKASVRVAVKMNDEPHLAKDEVTLSVPGFDNFRQAKRIRPGGSAYFDLPFPADMPAGRRFEVYAETVRNLTETVKVKKDLSFMRRMPRLADQDGMQILNGARTFEFGTNGSLTNFGYRMAAEYKFTTAGQMTSVFADQVVKARKAKLPFTPQYASFDLRKTSEDVASDRRALRAAAYLAVIAGANGIDWNLQGAAAVNPFVSFAYDIERELKALDRDFLNDGHLLVSTDGCLYAKQAGEKLLVVNTERFSEHESEFVSPLLPGGKLKLKLPVDGVAVR